MEKEFVPYEQALALKELGFDGVCLGYYNDDQGKEDRLILKRCNSKDLYEYTTIALLYQQAFRWFRINKKLEYHIKSDMMGYYTYIVDRNVHKTISMGSNIFETYEEAESACLTKLIELCKKV
jgi:hypothetical protein